MQSFSIAAAASYCSTWLHFPMNPASDSTPHHSTPGSSTPLALSSQTATQVLARPFPRGRGVSCHAQWEGSNQICGTWDGAGAYVDREPGAWIPYMAESASMSVQSRDRDWQQHNPMCQVAMPLRYGPTAPLSCQQERGCAVMPPRSGYCPRIGRGVP